MFIIAFENQAIFTPKIIYIINTIA